MKQTVLFLVVLFLMSGCATTPKVVEPREIHFIPLSAWAPDLTIVSVKGVLHGNDVDFSVSYRSGTAREFSFFDPPNGDHIMYRASGVQVGDGTLTFSIAVDDLKNVKELTMGFGFEGNDRSFLALNLYDVKRLIN